MTFWVCQNGMVYIFTRAVITRMRKILALSWLLQIGISLALSLDVASKSYYLDFVTLDRDPRKCLPRMAERAIIQLLTDRILWNHIEESFTKEKESEECEIK